MGCTSFISVVGSKRAHPLDEVLKVVITASWPTSVPTYSVAAIYIFDHVHEVYALLRFSCFHCCRILLLKVQFLICCF
jgi:hypothetical protein